MTSRFVTSFCAVALVMAPAAAFAQEPASSAASAATSAKAVAPPSAADLLFEQPQMQNSKPGSTLTYDYLRRSGIARGPFGPPMDDTIKLSVDAGKTETERNIRVQMFSGTNRFPAGPFEDMAGNPVIPLFLENHLKSLARVLEANPRYLKLAIRKGLREKAVVTPIKVSYQGQDVDGWKVETKPFEGDPLADRMRGMSNMTYTFVTSPSVPGEVVSIEAQSKNPAGGELLEERVSYDQKAG